MINDEYSTARSVSVRGCCIQRWGVYLTTQKYIYKFTVSFPGVNCGFRRRRCPQVEWEKHKNNHSTNAISKFMHLVLIVAMSGVRVTNKSMGHRFCIMHFSEK